MARNDLHERGLRHNTGQRTEKSKQHLKQNRRDKECDEWHRQMAQRQSRDGKGVKRHSKPLRKLRSQQPADDRAESPSAFEKTQTTRAGVKNVRSQCDDQHVCADHSRHQDRMRSAKRADCRLLA